MRSCNEDRNLDRRDSRRLPGSHSIIAGADNFFISALKAELIPFLFLRYIRRRTMSRVASKLQRTSLNLADIDAWR